MRSSRISILVVGACILTFLTRHLYNSRFIHVTYFIGRSLMAATAAEGPRSQSHLLSSLRLRRFVRLGSYMQFSLSTFRFCISDFTLACLQSTMLRIKFHAGRARTFALWLLSSFPMQFNPTP